MKKYLFILLGIIFLIPTHVFAHGGHGTGFIAGLTHPIFGLDHLVAIIGAGLLGYSLLKERPWAPALAFVTAMIVGGILGMGATPFGITEIVIVLSVLVAGVLIAFEVHASLVIYAILFAVFGFFHGHAHGAEMPEGSNVLLYVLGFVLGVGLLSSLGAGLTKVIKDPLQIRLLGAFIGGMGLMMLLTL